MQFYSYKEDWRRVARTYRKAIALWPDAPSAYYNLGVVLSNSGRSVEAAQRFLEAMERFPVGSEGWADTMARAFNLLLRKECDEVAKPEWWNDEGLKALSARVVRAAPDDSGTNRMRAEVLSGVCRGAWEVERRSAVELCGMGSARLWALGPRSAAEYKEAAVHFDRTAALSGAPAVKAEQASYAVECRSYADGM